MKDFYDFNLKEHNTFGIDVKCRRFIEFESVDELLQIVNSLTDADKPLLVLGGGIGNLIDRVLNGEVVDYINLLFMRFAVFNFADICVCVGVALWVLVIFLDEVHADDAASKEQ